MGIVEQAVSRLEQLRRSGIEVVGAEGPSSAAAAAPRASDHSERPITAETSSRSSAISSSRAAGFPTPLPTVARSREVTVDLERLGARGYLTPDAPRSKLANEFRVIKRPILKNVRGNCAEAVARPNLIMVTSSIPGEGKTFVSLNLAISLTMELDTTVLLVDGDVARPSLMERLGLPYTHGLLDILRDPALGLSDVLLRTNIDHLTLLPSGEPDPKATEMLAGDGMSRLLHELATRYPERIIVFDAPPLLPSPESRVLATQMGQVVMVVEAGRTLQTQLEQAMATLEGCPVVLPVLNRMTQSDVGSYYGHYGV